MVLLEELKKLGMFRSNGLLNPAFPTFLKNRKEWLDIVNTECPTVGSTSEKLYLLSHNFTTKPTCMICGSSVKFISFKEGYREFCSNSCKAKGTSSKVAKTNLERYGVERPAQSAEIQAKIRKTTKERFGVDNIFQDKNYIRKKWEEKYGDKVHQVRSEAAQKAQITSFSAHGNKPHEKAKATNLIKYGNECSIYGPDIWQKVLKTKRQDFWSKLMSSERITKATPLFSQEEYISTVDTEGQVKYYKFQCNTCGSAFEDYLANGKYPRCPTCYPPGSQGIIEKEIVAWLKEVLPNERIVENSRRIISPLELDIYLPDRNLAIELNEIYWHSEIRGQRGTQYHFNKTSLCEAQNITLLHFWDSEWINKSDVVKSIIKNKLGICDRKVGARSCSIVQVSPADSRSFFEVNHIQGYAQGSMRYGLKDKEGNLVAHIVVSKNRFKKNTYELTRFACSLNTVVVGGISKLWNEVVKSLPLGSTVLSYTDKRIFNGKSTFNLGFEYSHTNSPGMYYTKDYKELIHRLTFQKHKLKKVLPNFDFKKTEWENMQINGYDRVWDCGTIVYTFTKTN